MQRSGEVTSMVCASGTPALVTFTSFTKLQHKLDTKAPQAKHWTRDKLPADRSVFSGIYKTGEGATIGEGIIVTFAGWLMKLRSGSEESCNCGTINGGGKEVTDMHLVVISSSDRENKGKVSLVAAHGKARHIAMNCLASRASVQFQFL